MSVGELLHFFYGQFVHSEENELLTTVMDTEAHSNPNPDPDPNPNPHPHPHPHPNLACVAEPLGRDGAQVLAVEDVEAAHLLRARAIIRARSQGRAPGEGEGKGEGEGEGEGEG